MKIKAIHRKLSAKNEVTLFNGDCFDLLKKMPDNGIDIVITSPPYCMGKSYEDPGDDLKTFFDKHVDLLPQIYRVLKEGGSICWQVGYHVRNNEVAPLDFMIHQVIKSHKNEDIKNNLILRNRIIWTFGHGLNPTTRFSGRHEVIMWYTKGKKFEIDLNSVRIPQKYPGKKYYKGDKKGEYSGNPLGKNPSDVWDIPNVKANHIEKTEHPCQFPVTIPQRLIKALCPKDGVVFDPFVGSGTTGIAAVLEGRKFIGAELNEKFYNIAKNRIEETIQGKIRYREDKPILEPNIKTSVASKPPHFLY